MGGIDYTAVATGDDSYGLIGFIGDAVVGVAGFGGAAVGAWLLPVPGVGEFVGSVVGSFAGGAFAGGVFAAMEGKDFSGILNDALWRGLDEAGFAALGAGAGALVPLGHLPGLRNLFGLGAATTEETAAKAALREATKYLGEQLGPNLDLAARMAERNLGVADQALRRADQDVTDAAAALTQSPGSEQLQRDLSQAQERRRTARTARDDAELALTDAQRAAQRDSREFQEAAAKQGAAETRQRESVQKVQSIRRTIRRYKFGGGGGIAAFLGGLIYLSNSNNPDLPTITIGSGNLSPASFGTRTGSNPGIDTAIGTPFTPPLQATKMMHMKEFSDELLALYRIPLEVEAAVANFLGVLVPWFRNNLGSGFPSERFGRLFNSFNQSALDHPTGAIGFFGRSYHEVQRDLLMAGTRIKELDKSVLAAVKKLHQEATDRTIDALNVMLAEMQTYAHRAAPRPWTQTGYVLDYLGVALNQYENAVHRAFDSVLNAQNTVNDNHPDPLGTKQGPPQPPPPDNFNKQLDSMNDVTKRNNNLAKQPAGDKPAVQVPASQPSAAPRLAGAAAADRDRGRGPGGDGRGGHGGGGAADLLPLLAATGALGGGAQGQGQQRGPSDQEPEDKDDEKPGGDSSDAKKTEVLPPVMAGGPPPGVPGQAGGPPPGPQAQPGKPDQGAPPPSVVGPDGRVAVVLPDGGTIQVYPDVAAAISAALREPLRTDAQLAYSKTAAAWTGDVHNAGPHIDPASFMKDGGDIAVFQVEEPTGGESLRAPKNRPGATADGTTPTPQEAIVQAGFERKSGGNGGPPSAGKVVATHSAIVIVRGDPNADPNSPAGPGSPAQVEIIFNGQVIPFAPDQWEEQAKNHKSPDPKITPDPKGGSGSNDPKGGSGVKGDPKKSADPKGAPDPKAAPALKDPSSLGKFAGFIHPQGVQIPGATADTGPVPPPPGATPDQAPPPPAAPAAVWA